jgi:hypothetical protein
VRRSDTGAQRRRAMSVSNNLLKYDLECLRLAAECRQLASDITDPDLHSHFLRMAEVWTNLTNRAFSGDTGPEIN